MALALVSEAGLSSVSWFLVGVALSSLVVDACGSHAFAVPGTLGKGRDGVTITSLTSVGEWDGWAWWGWDWLGGDWSVLGG